MKAWYLVIAILGEPAYQSGPWTAEECADEIVDVLQRAAEQEKKGITSFEYKGSTITRDEVEIECTKVRGFPTKVR